MSRVLGTALLLLLAVSAACARTRTPRLHRYSAAGELQFTRTSKARVRTSHAVASHSERASRRLPGGRRTALEARNSAARTDRASNSRTLQNRSSRPELATRGKRAALSLHGDRARGRDLRQFTARQQTAPRNRPGWRNGTLTARAATPSDPPLSRSSAAAPPSNGIFAEGQSRPADDERLPVDRSPSAATATPKPAEAMVTSNDPLAAPIERPPALRTLSGTAESDPGTDPAPGAEGSSAAGDTPAVAPEEVSPALARPSPQELAEEGVQPLVLPGLYRDGRLVMPAPLKGTHDILVHQNLMADQAGLERIRDNAQLNRLRATHQLVDFPESASLRINPELPADRRCARVWTVLFAVDTARAFYARFHEPLDLSSAVRTVQFQLRLQRVNGNAAQVGGETASPHLTGQAIDLGKGAMSRDEIAWMRSYLLPLMQAGKIDVEEEFQQTCFHISVYRTYAPAGRRRPGTKLEEAQLH